MRNLLCVLSALIMLPPVSSAVDLTLSNGAVYKNITIDKTTPLGIDFLCDGSAGWADFRDMPLDEAKSFGYDPMKAAAFEKQLQDSQGSTLSADSSPDDIPQSEMSNPDNVPQTTENTVVVNPGDSIPYDTQIVYGGGSPQWVSWNGRYYPYNAWHHWYWDHHWVYSNGRYVPAHYYHHQYYKHNGRYYPYKHNMPPKKPDNPHRTPKKEGGKHFEHRPGGGIQHGGGGHHEEHGGGHSGGGHSGGGHGGGGGGRR